MSQLNIQQPSKQRTWLWVAVSIFLFIAVIALGASVVYYRQQISKLSSENDQLKSSIAQSQANVAVSDEETAKIIAELGQLIVLPTNEEPTVATVSDLSKLADQPFFEQAQINDKVVIYEASKKAILYRPSTKKVINIAPLIDQISPR